jgi:putative phage-type endonuclease
MIARNDDVASPEFIWRPVSASVEALSYESHEEWLAIRRTGIGGSDAPAVVGLNPYATAYDVYLDKRQEREPVDLSQNAAVRWGNRLEDAIAEEYSEQTGRVVHRVKRVLRRRDRPYLIASLDRRVVGDSRGLEIKTAGAHMAGDWGESGTDHIPEQYLVQVQHYMAVTGYASFDVAVLIGGRDFRIFVVDRDEELIASMMDPLAEFWRRVEAGEPPAVSTPDDARRLHPLSKKFEVVATADIVAAVTQTRKLRAEIEELEVAQKRLDAQIMDYMGDADTLVDSRGRKLVSWATPRSLSAEIAQRLYPEQYAAALARPDPELDAKAFKAAIGPKAYELALAPKGTRRFTIATETQK